MALSTILIIDDEAGLRESLEETVRDLGYDAPTAASGRAGLDRLHAEPIDAVLLDLRLGGAMDGLAVLKAIRALPAPPPVTILTAYATAQNTIEAIRLGAFDHLTKPIGRADLADNLKRMLSSRAMERAAPAVADSAEPASHFTLSSSLARPAPAKSSSRVRCTSTAGASPGRSSPSTAPPFLPICSNPSCSGM